MSEGKEVVEKEVEGGGRFTDYRAIVPENRDSISHSRISANWGKGGDN